MLEVITNHSSYPTKRNITDLPHKHIFVKKRKDVFKILDFLHYKFFGGSLYFHNLWYDIGQYDLVHLWNGISLGSSKWISTFEDYLPRWGIGSNIGGKYAIKKMAKKNCASLLAISNFARLSQLHYVRKNAPQYEEVIAEKLKVFHPPQKLLTEHVGEKKIRKERLNFIIVGHLFFNKGGGEILRVFDRLISENVPVTLTIVSKLIYGDWATKTTKDDYESARRLIDMYHGQIQYFEQLPNSEVLSLYQISDVALLPTWAETYGYSVLEAQATGTPVITTNIGALPEINNSDLGWLINVPRHEHRPRAKIHTVDDRKILSQIIEDSLYKYIKEIVANPGVLYEKSKKCFARISKEHDPNAYVQALEEEYLN